MSDADSPVKDVSDTAFMVAAYRAAETARPDALFRDPLAARLIGGWRAGDEPHRRVHATTRALGAWMVVIRTVIIDEFIQSAIESGVGSVLNLGAGLDTRPYRMSLPSSLRWIEVDYPKIIQLKNERLAAEKPRCRLERIELDLADVPARRQMLSDLASAPGPVLALTEGVIPYLDVDAVASIAHDLRDSAPIRSWIVDYLSPQTVRFRQQRASVALHAVPFRFAPPDWMGFFEQHGWHCREIRYIAEEAQRRARPIPLPWIARFLWALRRRLRRRAPSEGTGKFAGYALLSRDSQAERAM